MRRLHYVREKRYITADERKLNENDLIEIDKHLEARWYEKYFIFIVTRLLPGGCAAATSL